MINLAPSITPMPNSARNLPAKLLILIKPLRKNVWILDIHALQMAKEPLAHRTSGLEECFFWVNFCNSYRCRVFLLENVLTFLPGVRKKSWISLDLIRPGTWISRRPWHPRMPLNRSRFSFHWIGSCLREEKISGILYHHIFWGSEHPWGKMHPPPFVEWDAFGPSRNDGWWVVSRGLVVGLLKIQQTWGVSQTTKSWWDQQWCLFSTMYEHNFSTSMCDRIL